MIALLQRVHDASVVAEGELVSEIKVGLLVFVAVHRDDTDADVTRLAERILNYRVFEDAPGGRMNRSLLDEAGDLLLVPQFTLAADTRKGTRPSFSPAAPPAQAERHFNRLVKKCRAAMADVRSDVEKAVQTGRFGKEMMVALVNDGPVTFWLES